MEHTSFVNFTEMFGLNPFEFRAGLEHTAIINTARSVVLIPLNSGLAWSAVGWEADDGLRLNPFEFRAGLEHPAIAQEMNEKVLIPLNSGLAWSERSTAD